MDLQRISEGRPTGTIVLAAINARYRHTAFGLRYLQANLGELESSSVLVETHLQQEAEEIVHRILEAKPTIVGLGVYVWNAIRALEVVKLLKTRRPELVVVLGGPEVSHEWDQQEIVALADYTVCGEGEEAFRSLCQELVAGRRPESRVIHGGTPPLSELVMPYGLYTEEDLAHRVIYVEASRGCPYGCQFCLSSLDKGVRMVPMAAFFSQLEDLLERGARDFKFIDRTFNLRIQDSVAILRFFLERYRPGMSLHFEMVPDRLPEDLRDLLASFPPRTVQLEIGVQSWNPEVGRLIRRRQDAERTEENLIFLAEETGVHVHADLIVGLPGEDLSSFAAGFDRLHALGPQEIQVGILKRLRGTPIGMHDGTHRMVYNPEPPYDVISTSTLSEDEVMAMKRFARFWDLVVNSGNFIESSPFIWSRTSSTFQGFFHFSEWLYGRLGRTHHIQLHALMEHIFTYLVDVLDCPAPEVALAIARDLHRTRGRKTPRLLKPHLPRGWRPDPAPVVTGGLVRQSRHAAR